MIFPHLYALQYVLAFSPYLNILRELGRPDIWLVTANKRDALTFGLRKCEPLSTRSRDSNTLLE